MKKTKLSKEVIKIFAFDDQGLLKDDNQSNFIYHLSRIKWIIRHFINKLK